MKKTNLTLDSRIISHLGEALISDEKIALLELIKNSSDADALNCNIEIDTHYKSSYGIGKIVIEDDGNGMNPFIIENGFLKIATSFKTKYQKVTPIFKRIALGSKGIGRLALNQLGRFVEVETKLNTDILKYYEDLNHVFGNCNLNELKEENNRFYHKFSIDWSAFNNNELRLEDIDINIEKLDYMNNLFYGNANHGTKITVYGLKGIAFWEHKNTRKNLEMDVLSFVNPYLEDDVNFKVKINLNNEVFRSDVYDKKRIEKIADVTSAFWFNSKEKKLSIQIKRNQQYLRNMIESLIHRMDLEEFKCITESIDYQAFNDKYGFKKIDLFLTEKDILEKSPNANIKSLFINGNREYLLPGDFEGVFYGFNRQSKDTAVKSEIRNLLENISGVKLYRNNFRIFPYGESDWLNLGKISQTQISNIFTPGNTTGYVYIDGEENLKRLKELTNREGLVQDEYGKNFLTIMQEIVTKTIAYEDNRLRNDLNILKSKRNAAIPGDVLRLKTGNLEFVKQGNPNVKMEQDVEKASIEISMNLNELKSDLLKTERQDKIQKLERTIEQTFSDFKYNLNEIKEVKSKKQLQIELEKEYMQEFYPIMGATIVAETLAHEIIRLSNNIKYSSMEIRSLLGNDDSTMKGKILNHLAIIDSNTKFLSRYASLLDVNSYSKRRRYEVVDLKEHVTSVFFDSPLLKYKDITVELRVNGEGFNRKVIREGINIIFENLIINSVYWLEKMKIENPTIFIQFGRNYLHIWDNGFGIHPNISEELFEPFKTNKPNGEGRGMGLFIVRELLKEINADILLLQNINQYGNKYRFEIFFQGE